MKQFASLVFLLFVLGSCRTINRIVEITDSYKEIKSMTLVQHPKAFSTAKTGSLTGGRKYSVVMNYIFEESAKSRPTIFLTIQITTPLNADEFDSVMFLSLDEEKIRIVSEEYKTDRVEKNSTSTTSTTSTTALAKDDKKAEEAEKQVKTTSIQTSTTESSSSRLMKRKFTVPENLWVSVANSEKITGRIYLGNEGVNIKLSESETNRMKEFYTRALKKRDAQFPGVPDGLMKW